MIEQTNPTTRLGNSKVTPSHLRRDAFLYVRQSTLHQVVQNTESTQRQYALRQQAVGYGWPPVSWVTLYFSFTPSLSDIKHRSILKAYPVIDVVISVSAGWVETK